MTGSEPPKSDGATVYRDALDVFASVRTFLVGLVSVLAVAYLVGWVASRAYFSRFGAPWLALQLPPSQILGRSWQAFWFLGLTLFMVLGATELSWPRSNLRAYALKLAGLFGIALVLSLIFSGPTFLFSMALYLASLGVSLVFVFLLQSLREGRAALPRQSTLAFGCVIGVLGFVPLVSGLVDARRDADPATSPLPIVKLAQDGHEWRLLAMSGDTVFLTQLVPSGTPSRVVVKGLDSVEHISAVGARR